MREWMIGFLLNVSHDSIQVRKRVWRRPSGCRVVWMKWGIHEAQKDGQSRKINCEWWSKEQYWYGVCLRVSCLRGILPSGRFSTLSCCALYLQGADFCRLPFSASHFSRFSAEYGQWEALVGDWRVGRREEPEFFLSFFVLGSDSSSSYTSPWSPAWHSASFCPGASNTTSSSPSSLWLPSVILLWVASLSFVWFSVPPLPA